MFFHNLANEQDPIAPGLVETSLSRKMIRRRPGAVRDAQLNDRPTRQQASSSRRADPATCAASGVTTEMATRWPVQEYSSSVCHLYAVQQYVPGYTLHTDPQFDAPSAYMGGMARVAIFLRVKGHGDYLPDYAVWRCLPRRSAERTVLAHCRRA